ncbi:ladderlectin-like, partial [Sardina pilchardus]|uniref:ladderlectin-like n=1 Tax=Sardina pilchardus TaxID=27697 RepID=UPI002E10AA6B
KKRCFKFISTARTWAEAERFCLLLGGNLASVHSVEEYHFIQGLIVMHTNGSPATWIGGSDAQQRFCLVLGGHLASVHSVEEYHFIQGLIVTHTHGSPATWIGGSDAQQEGFWFWSDGSRFAFTFWLPGEPNNSNGAAEHCLQMNWGGALRWNDERCSLVLPSVCARGLIST